MTAVVAGKTGTSSAPLTRTRPRAVFVARLGPQYPLDPAWAAFDPALEDALFAAVNADRKANGLPPLTRDPALDEIASWKAAQCGWALYLDHADHIPAAELGNATGGQVDRPFGARFQDYGYVTQSQYAFAENLAYGFPDAAGCEQAFMSDVGHRGNVLSATIGIGIGVARTTENCAPGLKPQPGLVFWAQDFGTRPVNPSPPPPVLPQPGSKWRVKVNPLAKPVTVTASTAVSVTYENRKGIVGHLTLAAFLKRYSQL